MWIKAENQPSNEHVSLYIRTHFFLLWFLLSLAWLLIANGCALKSQPDPTLVPLDVGVPNWRGIYPGISTERDVRHILGTPAESDQLELFGEELQLFYPGAYTAHPVAVIIDKNTDRVLTIRVPTSADKSLARDGEDILAEYGEPEVIVGGYYPQRSVVTYLYAQDGIALSVFYRHDDRSLSGVIQTQYFEPMPTQVWLDTWGEIYGVGDELDLEP